MFAARATNHAVRLSFSQAQTSVGVVKKSDKTVLSAVVLAGLGLGLSSFSLKQLLSTTANRGSRSSPRL